MDGVNLLPYLLGQKRTRPHEQLFWRWYAKEIFAVRRGATKLIVTQQDDWKLFNLATDSRESSNIAAQQYDTVENLQGLVREWKQNLSEPAFPMLGSWKK